MTHGVIVDIVIPIKILKYFNKLTIKPPSFQPEKIEILKSIVYI